MARSRGFSPLALTPNAILAMLTLGAPLLLKLALDFIVCS